jgi:O-methyltransferase
MDPQSTQNEFPTPVPEAGRLYLDFFKQVVTRTILPERYGDLPRGFEIWSELNAWLRDRKLALVKVNSFDAAARSEGRDWPGEAETMIGLRRLDNLQRCIERVLLDRVHGDVFEAGVWRGGASIFMRAVLKVYGVRDRKVWVADSFQGLPKPDPQRYPKDEGDRLWTHTELSISLETVKANFARYGLLDEQVEFLPGWFRDTLPNAPVNALAVLRLDGDLYESTMVALRALYPKVSVGGYVIIDDYGALECCRAAVEDFRSEFGIREDLLPIDYTGVYWRVECSIPPVKDVTKPLEQVEHRGERERTTRVEHEPALNTLLELYESRPDLQQAFPEGFYWDFRRLLDWARRVAGNECLDGAAPLLRPYLDWFTLNSVDLSSRGAVPWGLLEAASDMSSNPLPRTLQSMRNPNCVDIGEHLTMLAILVIEFGLKEIVEIGTREGNSTIALLEAAKTIGGHLFSVDVEPCRAARERVEAFGFAKSWTFKQHNALALTDADIPHPIDLLFIDTFHLYSQTLAELRKFLPLVRSGGWIVLHDSVSFPGVSKAVLEVLHSCARKPAFYSFVHQNGLSLLRLPAN